MYLYTCTQTHKKKNKIDKSKVLLTSQGRHAGKHSRENGQGSNKGCRLRKQEINASSQLVRTWKWKNNALMQQKAECGLQLVFTLGTKGLAKLQKRRWGVSRRTR